ncbi:hypothetical protein ACFFLM_06200 [Deinococcus oregonensis]|uniref:Transposase n=1 Tax=Deinococcus oregonensis TaxID=1805970 RepID=A0ABV6AVN4_9DEIO
MRFPALGGSPQALEVLSESAQQALWKRLTSISQKDLVRLLCTELSAHINPSIIAKSAALKFTSSSKGTSTVRPASTGLDTHIIRQV